MVAPLGTLVQHGVSILNTVIDASTNRILAYLGDVKDKISDSDRAQWVQHVGFASRPGNPVAGKSAAQAVVIKRADRDVVIGSSDSRTQSMYGQLGPGETAIFSGGTDGNAQGRIIIKGDGSVNVYTRAGNSGGGAGMVIQLDAASNAMRALNGLGFGIIADASGVTITSGAASLTLGADGNVTLVGTKQTQVDGASIVIGSLAVPGVNSAIHGPTGLAGIASLKTLIE